MSKTSVTEKINICEIALVAKKNGISFNKTSKNLSISNTTLHYWLIDYESGKLHYKKKIEDRFRVPDNLINLMSEELNEDHKEIGSFMVCSGSIGNHCIVSIEMPDQDSKSYEIEIKQRILDKLEYRRILDKI